MTVPSLQVNSFLITIQYPQNMDIIKAVEMKCLVQVNLIFQDKN